MKSKFARESLTINTEHVLPNDTNHIGNLFGGRLLQWMDITGAIAAQRHSRRVCVTATVNNVSFNRPIKNNSIVTLEAKVSRSFHSSMEVFIEVFVEDQVTGERTKCNEAIYTFVAIDQNGSPLPVPEFDGALRRKQLALILSGRMKPEEATELKNIFIHD